MPFVTRGDDEDEDQSSATPSGAPPIDWDPNDPDSVNVLYNVSAWSVDQRAELAATFADAGHPHAWEGDELVVPEQIEDAVDELFDHLEREIGPFPVGLAADVPSTEFGLDEWPPTDIEVLQQALLEAEIPHRWEGSTLARRPRRRTRRRRPARRDRVGRPGDPRRRSRRRARGRAQPAVHDGRSAGPRPRRRHRPQRAVRPRRPARRSPAAVRPRGAGVDPRRHRDADARRRLPRSRARPVRGDRARAGSAHDRPPLRVGHVTTPCCSPSSRSGTRARQYRPGACRSVT